MLVDPACVIDTSHSAPMIAILDALRKTETKSQLKSLMEGITRELSFDHFALIHHENLSIIRPDLVDIKRYPEAVSERLFGRKYFRRDPIFRGCLYSGGAFIWSQINRILVLDPYDLQAFDQGAREGLNEGITVPYTILGECPGSCTFAGMRHPEKAERVLGLVQMIGVFAFQTARRLTGCAPLIERRSRLYPRMRDCIVLAGRGCSNKQIARALGITPRTVDGYLTEAYQLFDVHGRTELVVSAVLAGEIGLHELKPRQPE